MKYLLKDNTKIKYFNDMRIVFNALNGLQNKYNWLITDIECYPETEDIKNKSFISGVELTNILNKKEIQFVWGVFSAFPQNINIDIENLQVEPYIRDNYDYWDDVTIQHPDAMVEIDCCDSSYLTLVSRDEELAKNFKKFFINVFDLSEDKYSNVKNINWTWPELDRLENEENWSEALLYAYNIWIDNKLELKHLIRLGFLSWYILAEWELLTISNLNREQVKVILNEVNKFGTVNFNHQNEFLLFFGYMKQQFPLFFGDYQAVLADGIKMLKKSQFLKPQDNLNKTLYYGSNSKRFNAEYTEARTSLQNSIEQRFKGEGAFCTYFRNVLKD